MLKTMLYVVAVTTIATTYDVPVGILASVIPEVASIRRLYIGLRARYKYYRKIIVVMVWPRTAHAPIAV